MRRVPKALVHPDGELFCLWSGKADCYSPIFCDEDFPQPAAQIGLRDTGNTDLGALRWVPVHVATEQIIIPPSTLGPYEDGEGNF